ncbi:MAG: Spherulation-specific family 4 [Leptolyngbyaceae cyanobacterium CSU_1_4]|nr:Spherulation-specific family 4 [Leptolyngbyaceae cyanobacterium CSU_1_4]
MLDHHVLKNSVIFILLTIATFFIVFNSVANENALRILIPLYIYPTHYQPETYAWQHLALAQSHVPITAIINPNSGPGNGSPNLDYAQGLADLRAADITLLGYVSTRYGEREIAEVKREIDLYHQYYQVNGIFLDEAASSLTQLKYYQELYTYIKTKPALSQVVLNQGTQPDEEYLSQSAADTVVIFENYAREWAGYALPSYLSNYAADRLSILVHSAPDVETMKQIIDLALARHVKYVYVTDDRPDSADQDPWNQLPSYWNEEIKYIQALNQAASASSGR